MLSWTSRRGRSRPPPSNEKPPPGPRAPSDLLAFLAGEFADDIARLWPAPHTPFMLAEAPRRHLVCIGLSLDPAAGLREALSGPFKRALRSLAPDAPEGLGRALTRLGEQAWRAADYRLLIGRLADPATAKVLRHAPAISANDVRVLSALPADVAAAGARLGLTEAQSRLLAECHDGIALRDGPEAAAQSARRWAAATSAKALLERAAGDLTPQTAQPPHPGTARLRPLTTRQALGSAARRYRNCLSGRVLDGYSHYYEWLGSPGAIISICEDYLFGWRLDEAAGPGNAPLSPDTRREIEDELRTMGVHLGRSVWSLKAMVEDEAARVQA